MVKLFIASLTGLLLVSIMSMPTGAQSSDEEVDSDDMSATTSQPSSQIHIEIVEEENYSTYADTNERMLNVILVYDRQGRVISKTSFRNGLPAGASAHYFGDRPSENESIGFGKEETNDGQTCFAVSAALASEGKRVENYVSNLPYDPYIKCARTFYTYAEDGLSYRKESFNVDGVRYLEAEYSLDESGDVLQYELHILDLESGEIRGRNQVYEYYAPGKVSKKNSFYGSGNVTYRDYYYSNEGLLESSIETRVHEDGTLRIRTEYYKSGRKSKEFMQRNNEPEEPVREWRYNDHGLLSESFTYSFNTLTSQYEVTPWGKNEFEYDEYGNWIVQRGYSYCVESTREDDLGSIYYRTLIYYDELAGTPSDGL